MLRIVYEAEVAAPDICTPCSAELLAVTDDALAKLSRDALRELVRLLPPGGHADRVIYARACAARNDLGEAGRSLRLWREEMQALGVLAT